MSKKAGRGWSVEWYLQCAGCEACHLSSNRKPVCGRGWNAKIHLPFPISPSLSAALCTHGVTGPITDAWLPSTCLHVYSVPLCLLSHRQLFSPHLWVENLKRAQTENLIGACISDRAVDFRFFFYVDHKPCSLSFQMNAFVAARCQTVIFKWVAWLAKDVCN